jgi:hypothetical protein
MYEQQLHCERYAVAKNAAVSFMVDRNFCNLYPLAHVRTIANGLCKRDRQLKSSKITHEMAASAKAIAAFCRKLVYLQ